MAQTMTPSKSMTDGQMAKIKETLEAALRKAALPSEFVQQVLATKGQGDLMIAEMVAVVRKFVEGVSKLIIRRVTVNRARKPQEVLDATGRTQYTDPKVVADMPHGEGDGETEVVFFQVGRFISDADLDKEYELRGLKPADPYSLAAVNEADPAFADEKPNGTHWQDAEGKWCYATFNRWHDERKVHVDRSGFDWRGDWWFAGVRK